MALKWRNGTITLAGQRIKAHLAQIDPTFFAIRYADDVRIGFYSTTLLEDAAPQDPRHQRKQTPAYSKTLRPIATTPKTDAQREFDLSVTIIKNGIKTRATLTQQAKPELASPFHRASTPSNIVKVRLW
jgi:hypothetical protein